MRAGVLPVVFLVAPVVTGGLMNIGVDTNICSAYWQSQSVLLNALQCKRDEDDDEAERHWRQGQGGFIRQTRLPSASLSIQDIRTRKATIETPSRDTADGA